MAVIYNSPKIVTDGLVLCLDAANKLSYSGEGTSWTDLISGSNGTLTNGPTFSDNGQGSISFDKSDDYVDTNQQIPFDNSDPFTLCAWVYTYDASNNQIINNENTTYRGYQLAIDPNGKLFIFFRSVAGSNYMGKRSNSVFPTNTWKYCVGVHDGSSDVSGLSLYVDAVLQSATNVANSLTTTTVTDETTWVGKRRASSNGPFSGQISLAKIYNRVLGSEEIKQNYNATKGRFQ